MPFSPENLMFLLLLEKKNIFSFGLGDSPLFFPPQIRGFCPPLPFLEGDNKSI